MRRSRAPGSRDTCGRRTRPEAVVAGGDMDKDGLGGAPGRVFERRGIHEQLPVVFVAGKVKRHLVGRAHIGGERGRRREQRENREDLGQRSQARRDDVISFIASRFDEFMTLSERLFPGD